MTATRAPMPALLLASLAGWVALAWRGCDPPALQLCGAGSLGGALDLLLWRASHGALLAQLASWSAMLLATMPLLLAHPIAHVRASRRVRGGCRAVSVFLLGYAAVWMLAGGVLSVAAVLLRSTLPVLDRLPAGAALAAGIVVAWQSTPAKQRCLRRCLRLPSLGSSGPAADLSCLRFGLEAGVWCVGSCWALMSAPLLVDGWQVVVMPLAALVMGAERVGHVRPVRFCRDLVGRSPRVRPFRGQLATTGASDEATLD